MDMDPDDTSKLLITDDIGEINLTMEYNFFIVRKLHPYN